MTSFPDRAPVVRNPHAVTADFEAAVANYCGAPFAVATSSCTMALLLACAWHVRETPPAFLVNQSMDFDADIFGPGKVLHVNSQQDIQPIRLRPLFDIPKRTYVSVPMSIIHAGGRPTFRDEDWQGFYQLRPYPIWDSARWFTSGLWPTITREAGGGAVCVSFHAAKTLGIEQGGAILHGDAEADAWFRRMRFDGRTAGVAPADDDFREVGWHCYASPSMSAQGLLKLHSLPLHNSPLENSPYPDLSTFEAFR